MKLIAKILSVVATIISIVAYVLYNKEIFYGLTKPNIASWGIWAFITILNFTSYRSMTKDGVKSLLPTVNSIMCILTFGFAVTKGEMRSISYYDTIAFLLGVGIALIWWKKKNSTNSDMLANMLVQVTVALGFIPMLQGVWINPRIEAPFCWFVWTISFTVNAVVVILQWRGRYRDLVYPINCSVLHFAVGMLALR